MDNTKFYKNFGGLKTKLYLFFVIFILVPFLIYNLYERRLGYASRETFRQIDRAEICLGNIKEWQLTVESKLLFLSTLAEDQEFNGQALSFLANNISSMGLGIANIQFIHQGDLNKSASNLAINEDEQRLFVKDHLFTHLTNFAQKERKAAFFFQDKTILILYPVFKKHEEVEECTGFIVLNIPTSAFLKITGIDELFKAEVPFRLTYFPQIDAENTFYVVVASKEPPLKEVLSRYIAVNPGKLHLELAHIDGWYDTFLHLTDIFLVSLLILLLLGIAIIFKKMQIEKQKYSELSEKDSLTGLYNRRKFVETLTYACLSQEKFLLCYIDFDRFKAINDTYGHLVGDFFLKESSLRLSKFLAKKGTLFRLGGDEFAIYLKRTKEEDFAQYVEKLKKSMEKPFILGDISLNIEFSIGFVYAPEEGKDVETLLQMADVRMYVEKKRQKTLQQKVKGGEKDAKD